MIFANFRRKCICMGTAAECGEDGRVMNGITGKSWNTIENEEKSVVGRGILDIVIEAEITQKQIDSIPMHFVIDFSAISSVNEALSVCMII